MAPFEPTKLHPADQLLSPNSQYWLGTDELGRDLLSRLLYGARMSLMVAMLVVVIAGMLGVVIGVTAGYHGGWSDTVLMRLMDMIFAFPAILLALLLVAVLGSNVRNLIIAIAIVYIPDFARIARGSTKQVRTELYVMASRSAGASTRWIVAKHIMPNIMAPLLVQATVNLAYAILVEAALSYLGLGIQPPTPSLGAMLSTGKAYMELSPWVALLPGAAIMLATIGFNMLGDGLRDFLDPRLR
jgi:peptide/nickel transport system permease protein